MSLRKWRTIGVLSLLALLTLGLIAHYWGRRVPRPAYAPKTSTTKTAPAASYLEETDAVTYAAYAGSISCEKCHQPIYAVWKDSHHAQAERLVSSELDHRFFEPEKTFRHGSQTSKARRIDDRFHVVTVGSDGKSRAFPVERVLGVHPLRQFLVPWEGGRYQMTEIAVDPVRQDWFDVFGNEDRQPGEWGHWTGRGMTWNSMCAECHNTRLRKNYRDVTDSYATAMAERGVGCEACHGPRAEHIRWRSNPATRPTGPPPAYRFSTDQTLSICGSCHARRSNLTGDFLPGELFTDHYTLVIPDETLIFYPDGQIQDEDFEYTAFLGSRLYAEGVRCLDCHDPHSGKTRLSGNALCMRCHERKIDPQSHSHHAVDRPGGRCVDCHMPQTVYMQRHPRRDHGFTVPDPLLTKEHAIPNACNRCHTNRDTNWAIKMVDQWYGAKMERPARRRARGVADARAGRKSALQNLVKLTRTEPIPLWRAVAAGLLNSWIQEPSVITSLLERLNDSDPMVRRASVRALAPAMNPTVQESLRRRLDDSSRSVRVEAAWALRSSVSPDSLAGQDLLRFMRQNLDQPTGALQAGVYKFDRQNSAEGLEYFQRAVQWEPLSAPMRGVVASELLRRGMLEQAIGHLEAACTLAPKDPEYPYNLGLVLAEAKKYDRATVAFEEALRLNPKLARGWFNLGLSYVELQKPAMALSALEKAEAIEPATADYPYARANVLLQLGQLASARAALEKALTIDPQRSDAAALLSRINGPANEAKDSPTGTRRNKN
ncbi:MAG: tetratricopeptide repeat protein [Acidobacteria bacterium]|nr:tetratricopeptide repeat protein [Acidobacteriota bacterium]MBI3656749.1 tetratricopeptide repeat protein [Acidobacteriota bacterium]